MTKTRQLLSFFLVGTLFVSCTTEDASASFTDRVETAHAKSDFLEKDIIEFDLLLIFNGQERLNGTLTLSTDSRKGLIAEKNGDQLFFDGDQVFYKDRDSLQTDKLRFKAFTWPYFFLFPYKLTDDGTYWEDYSNKKLNEDTYEVEQLTFGDDIGDSPEDWYITYSDTTTHLIHAAAYIVTYSKSQEDAEEDPHAIVYKDYQEIDGIPIAHQWTFWGWRDGLLTEQLGEATISSVSFLNASERDLTTPKGFKKL